MSVRLLLAAAIMLIGFLILALFLLATDTALSVWEHLLNAPVWVRVLWVGGLCVSTVLAMLLAWRWLWPRRQPEARKTHQPLDADQLGEALAESEEKGIDVSEALQELEAHRQRQSGGEIYLAIYGEVSAGKSSLVNALLPDAEAESDPRAGSTRELARYQWKTRQGDSVILVDLPGFNLGEDEQVLAEARRAHLIIFLVDGDLTETQHQELERLQTLHKPLVLALNKADRYDPDDLKSIRSRLTERTGIAPKNMVEIQSGGREEVIRVLADGAEEPATRQRRVNVEPLRQVIQAQIDSNSALLESLQNDAVLLLASEVHDEAIQAHRSQEAEKLVASYSRRAVVGALAAVAPGSDLIIQGMLATRLIQELCTLYDVSVKEVQIEEFLKLAGGKVRKMSAITMAITGNALKAFPGLGTLSGGLLHAVAYGMIFDSLGKAAAQTLATRGELRPLPAAKAFEEQLHESLEKGAGHFAKMAAREIAGSKSSR